jgi:hypothetical protein
LKQVANAVRKPLVVIEGGKHRLPAEVAGCKMRLLEMFKENRYGLPKKHLDQMKLLLNEHAPKSKSIKHMASLVAQVAMETQVKQAHETINQEYMTLIQREQQKKKIRMEQIPQKRAIQIYNNAMRALEPEDRKLALRGICANLLLVHLKDYQQEQKNDMIESAKAA